MTDLPEPDLDGSAIGERLEACRPRLRRMVRVRLDPRLRGRVDPSDVIQEAFVDVTNRLQEYAASRAMPFPLWVRFLTGQKLLEVHRRHLGAAMRDARREVAPERPEFPEASSISMANVLLDAGPSPSDLAAREERAQRLADALDRMKPIDREVLVLRHFEQLTNDETAMVLGLSKAGASLRYVRAAERLKERLGSLADDPSGPAR